MMNCIKGTLCITLLIFGIASVYGNGNVLVERSITSGNVTAARDAVIGEILDPDDQPGIYRTIEGFFSQERKRFTDPSVRLALGRQVCTSEEVISIRVGAHIPRGGPGELKVRLTYFSRLSEVVTLVLRPDRSAPDGWFVLDCYRSEISGK